jgi:hypothetical protein
VAQSQTESEIGLGLHWDTVVVVCRWNALWEVLCDTAVLHYMYLSGIQRGEANRAPDCAPRCANRDLQVWCLAPDSLGLGCGAAASGVCLHRNEQSPSRTPSFTTVSTSSPVLFSLDDARVPGCASVGAWLRYGRGSHEALLRTDKYMLMGFCDGKGVYCIYGAADAMCLCSILQTRLVRDLEV